MSDPKKPNNLKTALILASVALMFAVGLFVKRLWFS
ncbi:cytochrome oxidase small assembly protein [Noviherbaspirillum sp. ST9]